MVQQIEANLHVVIFLKGLYRIKYGDLCRQMANDYLLNPGTGTYLVSLSQAASVTNHWIPAVLRQQNSITNEATPYAQDGERTRTSTWKGKKGKGQDKDKSGQDGENIKTTEKSVIFVAVANDDDNDDDDEHIQWDTSYAMIGETPAVLSDFHFNAQVVNVVQQVIPQRMHRRR